MDKALEYFKVSIAEMEIVMVDVEKEFRYIKN